jgi:hypothetical protein
MISIGAACVVVSSNYDLSQLTVPYGVGCQWSSGAEPCLLLTLAVC